MHSKTALGAIGLHPPRRLFQQRAPAMRFSAGVISGLASGLPLNVKPSAQGAVIGGHFSSAMDIGMLLASFSVTSPDTIHFGASLARLEEFAASMKQVS